jgi:hypothetical protein
MHISTPVALQHFAPKGAGVILLAAIYKHSAPTELFVVATPEFGLGRNAGCVSVVKLLSKTFTTEALRSHRGTEVNFPDRF